jgi:hypothetical protein
LKWQREILVIGPENKKRGAPMSKFIRNFLSLLLFLQIIIPCSTYAATVGEFTSVIGDVMQTRATEVIRPAAKSPIELEDLITTDRYSSTSMVFSDDSTIMLAENTKLEIKEFLFKDKSRTGIFSLMIGKVTATVKKYIGGDNVFEIHSPTAVVGVRGTGFEFIEATRDGNVDSTLENQRIATVTCTDGSLTVSALSDTGVAISTMVIEAGQVAVIIGGVITISKIGAAIMAAIARATETGGASTAGGAGTGTGGTAAAGGSATTATAGGISGGTATAATAGTVTAATGMSTAATVGLAIGGAAVLGGAAAAAGGGGGDGGGTSQTTFQIDQNFPQDCTNLNNVRAGQTIVFQKGVGRWPTPEEKVKALAGHYAVITLDGSPLNVSYTGTAWHAGFGTPGYGDGALANWVATSGTHTVTGLWTIYPQVQSCTFTISK